MAETPTNQKLYAMVVTQAKQKYRIYPSPGASHWVHKRYLELGGKFVDEVEENRKKRLAQLFADRMHAMHDKGHHHLNRKQRYLEHHHNKRD